MTDKKKLTLKEELESIPFKNRDIAKIRELQSENMRLKDQLGRKNKMSRSTSPMKLIELQGLRSSLGNQNVKF